MYLCVVVPVVQDAGGPARGALFDQIVKELRSEYAAAVTACAQRIHSALAENRRSIRAALERYGVNGGPGAMQEQVPQLQAVLIAPELSLLYIRLQPESVVQVRVYTNLLK